MPNANNTRNDYEIVADQQRRIAEIGRITSSSTDLSSVFSAFAEQAKLLVPFDRLAISNVDVESGLISDAHISGVKTEKLNTTGPYVLSSSALPPPVYEELRAVAANADDLRRIAKSDDVEDNRVRIEAGLVSALFVPIVLQGRLVGSLVFRSKAIDPYGETEIELANQIAAQIAGIVVSNQQKELLERQAHEREEAAREQQTLAEISRLASSTLNFGHVFSRFAKLAGQLVPHDRIVVNTWSEDGLFLEDLHVEGIEIEDPTPENVLSQYQDWRPLHEERKPWALGGDEYAEYQASHKLEQARFDAGLRSLLVVPLVWQGKTPGSLTFRSKDPHAYSEKVIELAESIAAQVAGAVATAQQYALLEREAAGRERLVEETRVMAEIGRIASSTLDFDEILTQFSEQAKKIVPHDRIVVATWTDDGATLTDEYVGGMVIEGPTESHTETPPQNDAWEQIHVRHEPVVIRGQDYENYLGTDQRELARFEAGLRAFMVVPVPWQGSVIATIAFRSTDPESYDEHQVSLAISVANQIAGTLAHSRQYSRLNQESAERERIAEESRRIAEIGRIVSSTLDLDQMFSSFVEQARKLISFDRLVISLVDEEKEFLTDVLIDGAVVDDGKADNRHPVVGDVKEDVIKNGSSIVANGDGMKKIAHKFESEQTRFDSGLRSLLIVPLAWQGAVVGTVGFRSEDPDAYGEHELGVAEQIAAQIAGAVASSNQYSLLADESAERTRLAAEQSRIAEIGRLVTSTLDIQDVLVAFGEQAKMLVPFDRIVITVANDEMTEVTDVLVDGVVIGNERPIGAYPFEFNKLQADVITNQQLITAGGEQYEHLVNQVPVERVRYDAGMRSLLMVPLVWQGRCFGTLNLRSRNPEAYGLHQIQLAEQICAQIAGAVATSNQYQKLSDALDEVQLLATALETSEDAIAIRDADTTIVYVNSAFERQTGHSQEELVGTKWVFPARLNQSGSPTNAWETVRAGKTWRDIVTRERPDGTRYTVDATLRPLFDENGEIDKFVGTRRDVTAQIAAAEINRTQAAAIEAAGDAVVILDTDTRMEWVNEAFVRDTGYSRQEALKAQSPFLRSEKDPDSIYDEMWAMVRDGKTWRGRVWTKRKDGTEFPTEGSLTPVFDENGNIAKYVGTRRNITDLIQAEQDREIRRDLDAQNQHLIELNKQREEFFSTVSHELRTPLTSVMAFADILSRDREGTLSNIQKEHLDVIKRNSKNLNDLVEDMLDFSRMSTDRLRLDMSEFEIHSLLDSVVESLEPTAAQRGQSLTIEPHTEPVWVKADYGRLNQVISNLITNSCKYSPPETRVTLSVKSTASKLSITVSDEGIGIAPEDLDQIYSPFFRSSQFEVREEIGTGLGLAISKTLVELHDGTIEAKSELDKGTDITVTFPRASSTPTVNARP